jgi:hypothetical protein
MYKIRLLTNEQYLMIKRKTIKSTKRPEIKGERI